MDTSAITHYINQISEEKNIHILLACETGSRAWGFPSPDSDYDVRLIYVHHSDWYISLGQPSATINRMFENNEIDIAGWELKKSLALLKKSNAALLERIQSPIVYQADDEFMEDISTEAEQCYSKIATIHHYYSMARGTMHEMHPEQPYKLKKMFYGLRAATLCKWIIERDEIPPIVFPEAYQNLGLSSKIVQQIDDLILFKSTQPESYLHQGESGLFQFIESCLALAESQKDGLSHGKAQTKSLNQLLRKYVKRHDH